jgi:hypothetical protein
MANDDKTLRPGEGPPKEEVVSDDVGKKVEDVLEGKTLKESQSEDPQAQTLEAYLRDLEKEKTPNSMEKVRKIRRVLMFLSQYVDVTPGRMLMKKQAGLTVGEAFENHVEFDPVIFDGTPLKEEDLTVLRHVLLHETLHLDKDIANEGFVEMASTALSGDEIQDYHHLVGNVAQVTNAIADHYYGGDKKSAILEMLNLYGEKKYDDLHDKFVTAYQYDKADTVFQLAFPELNFVAEEDGWREDEDSVDEVAARTDEPASVEPSEPEPDSEPEA